MNKKMYFKMKDDRFITSKLYFPYGDGINQIVYNYRGDENNIDVRDCTYLFVHRITKKGYYLINYFLDKQIKIFITHSSLERIDL